MTTNQTTSRQYRYRIEHTASRVATFTAWLDTRDEAWDVLTSIATANDQHADIHVTAEVRGRVWQPDPRPFFLRAETRP
jgi:hypothetical protein